MKWLPMLLLMPFMAQAKPWTVSAAVERALSRSPAHAAAALQADAVAAGAERAQSAWLPRVQVVGRAAVRGPLPSLNFDTGFTPPGRTEPLKFERELGQTLTLSAALEVAWRAWDFGARAAQRDAVMAQAEAVGHTIRQRDADIAWAVRQSYAAAAYARAVERVTDRAIKIAQRAVSDAEAYRAAGMAADINVASAKSRLAELVARRADAGAAAVRARATLKVLLGLDGAVELADGLDALNGGLSKTTSVPPAAESALAKARAVSLQRDAVDAALWPTLDLHASGGWADPQTFMETDSGLKWQAGLRLTWSIFNAGNRRHAEQLDLERQSLKAAAQAATEQAAIARADAEARMSAAIDSVEAAQARVAAAEVYLKAARAGLKAGAGTSLDLERAEGRLDEARLAVARARFDGARGRADRLRADGVAMEEIR